ncbi:hypothetical protein LTR66_016643, partial [Elasticomyces elasticus]
MSPRTDDDNAAQDVPFETGADDDIEEAEVLEPSTRRSLTAQPIAISHSGTAPTTHDIRQSTPQIAEFVKRLVIALDLGTTHSGIAWIVDTGNPQPHHINVVKIWESRSGNIDKAKCPTRIAYPEDNANIKKACFGFDMSDDAFIRTWFKLLFACDRKLKDFDDPLIKET